jgi:hypothetical protein
MEAQLPPFAEADASALKVFGYGVRKRSFRLLLKLTLQHSKGYRCGVRKRSFRPTLKLSLQHSKEFVV